MGTILTIFMGIGFKGAHSGSTLSVSLNVFGLTFLFSIYCRFFMCAPGYILGSFYTLVHNGLLM